MVDVDPSKLLEGEYLIIGTPRIEIPPIPVEERNAIMTFSFRQLQIRTKVRSYEDSRFQLYASAERVRNYVSYLLLLRLPMSFDMIGRRQDNGQWLPIPAVYEGGMHLPLSDGGTRDISIFKTGFGPPEGEPPPLEARQSLESLSHWHVGLNKDLSRVQQLLDRVPVGSVQDHALNLFGQALWAEDVRGKFADSWRVVEAVAKHDFMKRRVGPTMMFNTMNRRTKQGIQHDQFQRLKAIRDMVMHQSPALRSSRVIHGSVDSMFGITYEIVGSVLKDTLLAPL